jgi:hypothetical protein
LTDSAPASTARPESPRETGESLISAYGASTLPLSIAHPGETLEMLGKEGMEYYLIYAAIPYRRFKKTSL